MPAAKVFIDSAAFLYTIDEFETFKRNTCRVWLTELAAARCAVTNLQVLNEVASVLTRKSARFPNVDVFAKVDEFAVLGSSSLNWATTLRAREIRKLTLFSWWDSLLLASALRLGCTHFLSEDLQDGQSVEGLTIVDPFAHSPGDIISA